MKAIILAGGKGTRLYPITQVINKHLLPVYDKPMIYYALSNAMLAGCSEILLISTSTQIHLFKQLLKDGLQWGIKISYLEQQHANGIAEAFILAADFIAKDNVWLFLGDNIIFGHELPKILIETSKQSQTTIFSIPVIDPQRYGILKFNNQKQVIKIIEKPQQYISNHAVIGIYYYDNQVIDIAKTLKPSARGELEITDINNIYLKQKNLKVQQFGRGIAWLDTGTFQSILDATNFINILSKQQALHVAYPEEIALNKNYISKQQFITLAKKNQKNDYGKYLLSLIL